MKTKIFPSLVLAILFASPLIAQDRTIVNAVTSEISDNLDLRAVASIFGEAHNLEDFERKLNDPEIQISNLDLNNDDRVDYLRVIESVEGYTHLIVLQSVLGLNTFQDVATIEVERDRYNQISVQVVGDVYMYGSNYIYEPVYAYTPPMYVSFWNTQYRPYYSSSYWDFYPIYYYAWNPCPVFRYRNNVNGYINLNNYYNYVNLRRSERAVALYSKNRANYCERQYPSRAFAYRNTSVKNRYELDQTRSTTSFSTRNQVAYFSPRNAELTSKPIPVSTRNLENTVRKSTHPVRNYAVSHTTQTTLMNVNTTSQNYSLPSTGSLIESNPRINSGQSRDINFSRQKDDGINPTRVAPKNIRINQGLQKPVTGMRSESHENFGMGNAVHNQNIYVSERASLVSREREGRR